MRYLYAREKRVRYPRISEIEVSPTGCYTRRASLLRSSAHPGSTVALNLSKNGPSVRKPSLGLSVYGALGLTGGTEKVLCGCNC